MSSNTLSENQLKFNLNSLVSNLNLINVIKQPKPIVIENVRQYHRIVPNTPQASSEFKYIDEEKLAMYSFIAKRNLKEKEWKSSLYEQMDEKPVKLSKENEVKSQKRKEKDSKKRLLNIPTNKPHATEPIKASEVQVSESSVDIKLKEIRALMIEINNCFGQLEICLDKYKTHRIRLDCADEDEEDKKIRIQNEKIKNSSRLMYNFQNQLRICELNMFKASNAMDNNQKIQILGRLINTNRYTIKAVENFSANYPYRNKMSDNSYKNLFKHLQSSIEQLIKIYPLLDNQYDAQLLNSLQNKLQNCKNLIDMSADVDEASSKQILKNDDKPNRMKKKVLQTSKSKPNKKVRAINVAKKPNLVNDEPLITEYSNFNTEPKFEQKKTHTARLFPSSRIKSVSPVTQKSKIKENLITDLKKIIEKRLSPSPQRRARSLSEHDSDIPRPLSAPLKSSKEYLYEPARKHITSPKLSKIGYKLRNSKESFENDVDNFDQDAYDELIHLKRINSRKNNFSAVEPNNLRSHMHQRKLNFDDGNVLNDCIERMDHIKDETDAIRRKYEMLRYSNELKTVKKVMPYAELYLKADERASLIQEQTDALAQQQIFHRLNRPNQDQLNRIFEYKNKYEVYAKQSALSEETHVNEIKLFERLSDELFNECFTSVCKELESVNDQLTNLLVDNELKQD